MKTFFIAIIAVLSASVEVIHAQSAWFEGASPRKEPRVFDTWSITDNPPTFACPITGCGSGGPPPPSPSAVRTNSGHYCDLIPMMIQNAIEMLKQLDREIKQQVKEVGNRDLRKICAKVMLRENTQLALKELKNDYTGRAISLKLNESKRPRTNPVTPLPQTQMDKIRGQCIRLGTNQIPHNRSARCPRKSRFAPAPAQAPVQAPVIGQLQPPQPPQPIPPSAE